jgi:hypothetical protein
MDDDFFDTLGDDDDVYDDTEVCNTTLFLSILALAATYFSVH